ncbi:hypothetical protein KUTeg_016251 [Tegillarca granosa]|uniref:EF-hand domain-containing protein n=1 Tax=Tegillarca granosa TaxID=220873 RepID=A0ABQ9EKB8_TEGGR|nr:hypothetical protein KUTeg_016251 [Tegillarca granosa]
MGQKASKLSPKTMNDLLCRVEVDLSREEIQEWYNEFKSTLPEGQDTMSKGDFIKVYNKMFAGDATYFADHVFRTFDKNHDGKLNFKEFIVGVCMSGSSDPEVKMKWAFQMYDIDGDGYISRDEMENLIKAISLMALSDDNSSPRELTESLFQKLDTNKDNLISQEEFIVGAQKDTMLMDILQFDPNPDDGDAY